MRRKNKKHKIVAFLFSLILIGIGYAYLTANLKITGTTKIGNARFDVHFENAILESTSSNVTYPSNSNSNLAQGIPVIKGENNTELEWNVILNQPGDYYIISVDIVNSGDIDAQLDLENSNLKVQIGDEEESVVGLSSIYVGRGIFLYENNSFNFLTGGASKTVEYINAGDTIKLFMQSYVNEETITTEEWENIRGKNIKITANLKYIQGMDNPHSNSNNNLYNGVSMKFENATFDSASSTTTFPNEINVPTVVNDRISEEKTSHNIEYNVIFNQPGDYYTYTVSLVNDGTLDARKGNSNSEITVGDAEPQYFGAIDDNFEYLGDIFEIDFEVLSNNYFSIVDSGETVELRITLKVKDDISEENLALIQGKNVNVKYYMEYREYNHQTM